MGTPVPYWCAGLAVGRRSSPLNRDGVVPSQSHRLDNRLHQGPFPSSCPEQPQAAPGQSQDRSPQGPTGYFNNPACDRPTTARAHSGQETERNGPRRLRASRGHISLYKHTFSCLPIFTGLHTLPAKNMEYFLNQRFFAYLWSVQGVSVLEIHSYEQILLLGS